MKETVMMNEKEKLALDILEASRDRLLLQLTFLAPAIFRLPLVSDPEGTLFTDGSQLNYGVMHVLKTCKLQKELMIHDYLHTVLHCLFRHPFIGKAVVREYWDLSCDLAVENALQELDISCVESFRTLQLREVLEKIRGKVSLMSAEHIYQYMKNDAEASENLLRYSALLKADDHSCWYVLSEKTGGRNKSSGKTDDKDKASGKENLPDSRENIKEQIFALAGSGKARKQWLDISSFVQSDMETFSKSRGKGYGKLLKVLAFTNRERCDYAAFLKRFSVYGEVNRLSHNEFDYIYYTFGLNRYGNMPLVEPLEYSESKRIREFVIAIDTSASVDGKLIRKFIKKTWELLKSEESYFRKVNIHIIQCDKEIQEDHKITGLKELDDFLASFQARGFGGTDFRPVFDYVDRLIEEKEFQRLKGLIYFTDGDGIFPPRKPAYDTAFVFLDNGYAGRDIPIWAACIRWDEYT
ncbi:MAG: metallopeptidase [Blautia sp.]|nr:metallopeptidase [Blautia sp.]